MPRPSKYLLQNLSLYRSGSDTELWILISTTIHASVSALIFYDSIKTINFRPMNQF